MIERWRNHRWFRRGIFLAANAVALAALFLLLAWPIQALFAERAAQIASARALLARLNAIVVRQPAIEKLGADAMSDSNRAAFLQGTNEGVVAANLQTLVKGMAQTTGARLRSVRTLPSKVTDEVKFVGVQLEISGTIQAIHQTARTVETAKPFLFIVGAVLKPSQQAVAPPNGIALPPTINAQLDIVGAVQIEGKD